MYHSLGPRRSYVLPLFHFLSGSDTTSQLFGCGKKTAWAAWDSLPELTDVFTQLMENPDSLTLDSEHMKYLERYFILQYSKTCKARTVNSARHLLFTKGWTELEDVSHACRIILKCGCKKACRGNCKCSRNGLEFIALAYAHVREAVKTMMVNE